MNADFELWKSGFDEDEDDDDDAKNCILTHSSRTPRFTPPFFTHRPTPLRLTDESTTPFEKTTLFTRRMSPTTIFTDDADS